MRSRLPQLTLLSLLCGAGAAFAQGMPTSQPPLIEIVREHVRPGRGAEHAKIEAGWPAAFAKVKSPDYYIALVSMTGPTEAWLISRWRASGRSPGSGCGRGTRRSSTPRPRPFAPRPGARRRT